MSTLVLLSGGMDSVIALYFALSHTEPPNKVHALTINYGQRHVAEVSAAVRVISRIRRSFFKSDLQSIYRALLGEHIIQPITIPPVGSLLREKPVTKYDCLEAAEGAMEVDASFIPYRNILFLSYAAMWARRLECDMIATGLRGGFPDCSVAFEHAVQKALRISEPNHQVALYSPVHVDRAESVRIAQLIPECMEALSLSLTCFEGEDPPCGRCLPCIKRAEGFKNAGYADPIFAPRERR